MESPFAEKAIPMVSVDENTGSTHVSIQNMSSPTKLSTSSEPSKDLSQLYLQQDSTEQASPICSIECFSIEAMDLEWVPLSILALKVCGVGVLLLREPLLMENRSTSQSLILKESVLQMKTQHTIPKSLLWLFWHLVASSITLQDPLMKMQFKI